MLKDKKSQQIKLIIVNSITSLRIIGTFLLIPIYFYQDNRVTCLCALFILLTDCIDGQLARRLHVSTFFGSLLDAVSDKMFGITSLILLSLHNPIYLSIVTIEAIIFFISYRGFYNGSNIKTSKLGKVKTVCEALTIIVGFYYMDSSWIPYLFIFSTLLIDFITLYSYILKYQVPASKKKITGKRKSKKEIKNMLFNPEFFQKNKDKDLRKLLYK